MSVLQFIFGNSGSGKSRCLYQKIIEESRLHPERSYLVIVPEQFTMQTQRDLVMLHPDRGIMNIDVLSFRRLAHRVFEEVGADQRTVLTETGKNLMIRRVAEQQKEELQVLGAKMNRTGYVSEVKSILSELMQYEISDTDLQNMLDSVENRPLLHAKLADIRVLYRAFLDYQRERFMKPEELLEVLAQVAGRSELLRKSVLAFDGYAGFTPSQLTVLKELMRVCPMIYLTVTIDARENFFGEIREHELFAPSRRLIRSVMQCAADAPLRDGLPVSMRKDFVSIQDSTSHSLRGTYEMYMLQGKIPSRSDFKWIFPRNCEGTEQLQDFDDAESRASESGASEFSGAFEEAIVLGPGKESGGLPRFRKGGALYHLEQNLFRKRQRPFTGKAAEASDGDARTGQDQTVNTFPQDEISLHELSSPAQEVHFAARTISRLVREEHYRYREIAVIAGDMAAYGNYVNKIFPTYGIPAFVDETRQLLLNPCLEFVRGALAMVQQDFSRESVFRFLRTGMAGLTADETDRLENYCLAAGIRGRSSWEREWTWCPAELRNVTCSAEIVSNTKGTDDLSDIDGRPDKTPVQSSELKIQEPEVPLAGLALYNSLRARFMERAGTFAKEMQIKGRPLSEYARCLYQLLEDCGLQQQLKNRENELRAETCANSMDLAGEYRQVYPVLIGLLDEMVDLLGEEAMDCAEFAQILDAGLSEAKIGIIPPGIDQVQVGDIRRSRLANVKVLFFLGLNDGWVPSRGDGGGIVSDTEREILIATGANLAPTARENSYIQRFYLYQNLTKPQNQLYLSWCLSSGDGTAMRPSYLVGTIRRLFPDLEVHKEQDAGTLLSQVTSRENGMLYLLHGLQNLRTGRKPVCMETEHAFSSWLEMYRYYLNDTDYHARVRTLACAAFSGRQGADPEKLTAPTAMELYLQSESGGGPGQMTASVTRLEQFAGCAFSHFISYGLRLKERTEYGVKATDLGTLFHEAIELFSRQMLAEGRDWGEYPYEEQARKMDHCVDLAAETYEGGILHADAREEYTIRRLKRILRRTVWVMREQMSAGRFRPVSSEISFADTQDLGATQVLLDNHGRISLQGRIDRIDTVETEDTVYVKVVDYKSGTTQFDLVSLYYGLQLQLVVYLNAALEMEQKLHPGKKVVPAGIFYHHLQDPVLEKEEDPQRASEALLKKMRPNGLVNGDGPVVRFMDKELAESSCDSLVIPVGMKKDGTPKASSSLATTKQFEELSAYVSQLLSRTGNEILAGEIGAHPFEDKNRSACDYCPYADVCGMDKKLPGNCAPRRPQITAEEIWERLSKSESRAMQNRPSDDGTAFVHDSSDESGHDAKRFLNGGIGGDAHE
ncbi:MAG: exodeoxyribonuclease V subunit gamma [Lachnospiraceae bacterium]|nr:exodeoxyribonuclease V subunit gamma [Lachnospiraceae bacterium]